MPRRPGLLRHGSLLVLRGLPRSGAAVSAPLTPGAPSWLRHLRATLLVALVVAPLAWYSWFFATSDLLALDLRTYLHAANDVARLSSPYVEPTDPIVASELAYVYPPLVAFVLAPATLMPESATIALVLAGYLASLGVALHALGIRDWRCYAAVLCWPGVHNAIITTGSVSAVLVLGLALAWRFRDHAARTGVALGLIVALKLFLWPVAVWLIATGRRAAVLVSAGAALVAVLAPWALLRFEDLRDYGALLERLASLEQGSSYSTTAGLMTLGTSSDHARALAVAAGAALLAASALLARRRADRQAFTLAVLGSLVVVPIAWQHFYIVLLVPLAVARPRLTPLWFLPCVTWLAPFNGNGEPWQTLLVPVTWGVVAAVTLSSGRLAPAQQAAPSP